MARAFSVHFEAGIDNSKRILILQVRWVQFNGRFQIPHGGIIISIVHRLYTIHIELHWPSSLFQGMTVSPMSAVACMTVIGLTITLAKTDSSGSSVACTDEIDKVKIRVGTIIQERIDIFLENQRFFSENCPQTERRGNDFKSV